MITAQVPLTVQTSWIAHWAKHFPEIRIWAIDEAMIVGEGFSFILGTAIWRIIHVMIPAMYECKPIICQVRIAQQYLVASKFLTGVLQLYNIW